MSDAVSLLLNIFLCQRLSRQANV